MESILHYLFAGAAFAAGVIIIVTLVALALSKKPMSKDLAAYWQTSIDQHRTQVEILARQAKAVEAIAEALTTSGNTDH